MTDPRIRLLAAEISLGVSHERLRRIREPIPDRQATFDQLAEEDQQTWTDVATVVAGLCPDILDVVVREVPR
jgi:hypothetical protein